MPVSFEELMQRYSLDRPMDFADATLVQLRRTVQESVRSFTIDHDDLS